MTAAWMRDRVLLAEKLRTVDYNRPPRLDIGDAKVIAATAGLTEELEDEIVEVDSAIGDLQDARDGGMSREDVTYAREARDGAIEEFLDPVRRALLPEVVAAEDAEIERIVAETRVLTGLPGIDNK